MERPKIFWEEMYVEKQSFYLSEQQINIVFLGLEPSDMLLDLGSGTGNILRLCEERSVVAVGIDISGTAIKVAIDSGIKSKQIVHDLNNVSNLELDTKFKKIILNKSLAFLIDKKMILSWVKKHMTESGEVVIITPIDTSEKVWNKSISILDADVKKILSDVFNSVELKNIESGTSGDVATYVCR